MLRTAAIALTICLVCPASASADDAPPRVIHPKTFVCVFPGVPSTKAHEQRQPIPPGQKIEVLCPSDATAYLFFDPAFGHLSPFPTSLGLDSAAPHPPQPDAKKSP